MSQLPKSTQPGGRYDASGEAMPPALGRERIEQVAEKYRIPVYEDAGVVEAFARLEVTAGIPNELYGVMADVLAFVYGIDGEPPAEAEKVTG